MPMAGGRMTGGRGLMMRMAIAATATATDSQNHEIQE